MTSTELLRKIRSEIIANRTIFSYSNKEYKTGYEDCADKLLTFIDSLDVTEEPVSKDLDEEMSRFFHQEYGYCCFTQTAIHFANWQKAQIMNNAIDGAIHKNGYS